MTAQQRVSDDSALVAFLQSEKIAVVCLPVDEAGTPHAAAVVFYCTLSPLAAYFVTARDSEKMRLLHPGIAEPAAMVIGTYNHADYTVQLRGQADQIDYRTVPEIVAAYHAKRGNTHDDVTDPAMTLVRFTPNWGRYTDYAHGAVEYPLTF